MIQYLFYYINHTKPAYLLLFFTFLTTIVSADYKETMDEENVTSSVEKSVITIKGNTTFYIAENTLVSNADIKRVEYQDSISPRQKKTLKKTSVKSPIHKLKPTEHNNLPQPLIGHKQKNLSYLPYKSSTLLYVYSPSTLDIFHETFYNRIARYKLYINKVINHGIQYEESYYTYIFCDYSICLSHLEIRSPSYFS